MFKRQTTGSVVCSSCGSLVGVNDDKCYTCGRRNPGLWGYAPVLRRFGNDYGFLGLVVYGSCALYALTLILTVLRGGNVMAQGPLSLLAPDVLTLFAFGAAGSGPVFEYGRWWSVLTAGWLHASALHILFNMLWVRQLGPEASEILGPGRTIIVYVVGGVTGFAASSIAGWTLWWMPIYFLRGAGITVGASAAIFALLGALVCYGRRSGSSLIHGQALNYAIIMGLYGLLPGMGVDNYAHLGGFVGGYVVTLWLNPLQPERIDHLVGATLCIAATVLAFIATLWGGLPLLLGTR